MTNTKIVKCIICNKDTEVTKFATPAKAKCAECKTSKPSKSNKPSQPKTNMKLTKAMQAKMDEFINLPYADYSKHLKEADDARTINFYLKSGRETAPYYGIFDDGTIRSVSTTGTLQALEKRGLIEVVELGGDMADRICLLQHENKNVSIFNERNLTRVEIYTTGYGGREVLNNTVDFIEDMDLTSAHQYWRAPIRHTIMRVVNVETGEDIFKSE